MLETERLLLRRLGPDDLDAVARWNADPDFMRHMGRGPMTRNESARSFQRYERHWDHHGFGLLGVADRASGALIGRAGVQYHRVWPHDPEVGWGLDPAWWGRGLATEAGRACVAWGFGELALDRLVSITTAENSASRRVMAKLGFRLLRTVTSPELRIDLLVHALDSSPA